MIYRPKDCPICNKALKHKTVTCGYWGAIASCEEYAECSDNFHEYKYMYEYGHSRIRINNDVIYQSYNEDESKSKENKNNFDKFINNARESYNNNEIFVINLSPEELMFESY